MNGFLRLLSIDTFFNLLLIFQASDTDHPFRRSWLLNELHVSAYINCSGVLIYGVEVCWRHYLIIILTTGYWSHYLPGLPPIYRLSCITPGWLAQSTSSIFKIQNILIGLSISSNSLNFLHCNFFDFRSRT